MSPRPTFLAFLGAIGVTAALVVACGSTGSSTFVDETKQNPPTFGGPDGGFGLIDGSSNIDLYANDPPPAWCGPDAGAPPPQPGGTEECPDDKNKPGCGCTKLGEKAPCWTGLRKHRSIGVCKDGETTCISKNETDFVWSECVGEVLPTPGATKGAAACACFSAGQWKIANLSPCTGTWCTGPSCTWSAVSTIVDPGTGIANCPAENPPTAPPAVDWSTDTLKVDCEGHFKLCLRLRAGVFETPSTNDCVLTEVCTEADYTQANVEQAWPNLPAWLGKDSACAKKWYETPDTASPGYAEMIVKGLSVRCDPIDDGAGNDLIFNRIKYCPRGCNKAENKNLPECIACQQSGQGQF